MNTCTRSNNLDGIKQDSLLSQLSSDNFLPNPKTSRIAVAMSGGVDSSVALYLLKEAGYEVVGITAWIVSGGGKCCDYGVVDAYRVCEALGVEHHAVDLREDFNQGIMTEFHQAYARGETPIPCISCNNDIKWGSLLAYSVDKLGATHLASGHYSKLLYNNGSYTLLRPLELNKDQSYMLWGLTQDQLSKTVFPLADFLKPDIRKIAEKANLSVANKADSQDICFVHSGMTNSSYLTKILGEKKGQILEISSGELLGEHNGSYNYTYGQRKGLGIAYKEPLYVVKIDSLNNIVYVGTRDKLQAQVVIAANRNIVSQEYQSVTSFEALAQIRYNMDLAAATINLLDNGEVEAIFHEPVSAITPGQALVFFDAETGNQLIGGAWIKEGL